MFRSQHPPCRRGFSLVQALVCVAIIAVLTAILIPTVSRARAHGRAVTCVSNLRQIDQAFSTRDGTKALRLPGAGEWIPVVLQSADDAHRVLSCPDGGKLQHAEASAAYFHTWYGNGRGMPQSSRLAGHAPWRPSRVDVSADRYELSYAMRPNQPNEVLTIRYDRLGATDMWRATVVREPANYRTDCFIVGTGQRYVNITTGFTVDYKFEHGVDYGFNVLGDRLMDPRNDKILVMDYNHNVIDFDGYPVTPANNDDDPSEAIPAGRHLKRINALMTDGSVRTFVPSELQPANDVYALAPRGANPGGGDNRK